MKFIVKVKVLFGKSGSVITSREMGALNASGEESRLVVALLGENTKLNTKFSVTRRNRHVHDVF
jgi:hypothetical protein